MIKSDEFKLSTNELELKLDSLRLQAKEYQQQVLSNSYNDDYIKFQALLMECNTKIKYIRDILSLRRKPKVIKY